MQDQQILDTELMKRKIQFYEEKDILRWGYEEKGTYSTREAYNILIKEHMVLDSLWSKIWDPSIWPKVSTFLWLLCHNKILTWDNLRKRNFYGPPSVPTVKRMRKPLSLSCISVRWHTGSGKRLVSTAKKKEDLMEISWLLCTTGTTTHIRVRSWIFSRSSF